MKNNKKRGLLVSLTAVALGLSLLGSNRQTVDADTIGPTTVIANNKVPDTKSPSFLYGRGMVTLHTDKAHKGRLYATSEHYVNGTPTFLIFESLNNAKSWKKSK